MRNEKKRLRLAPQGRRIRTKHEVYFYFSSCDARVCVSRCIRGGNVNFLILCVTPTVEVHLSHYYPHSRGAGKNVLSHLHAEVLGSVFVGRRRFAARPAKGFPSPVSETPGSEVYGNMPHSCKIQHSQGIVPPAQPRIHFG